MFPTPRSVLNDLGMTRAVGLQRVFSVATSLTFIFPVEEGGHRLRKERGFLDEGRMTALFKYDEARIRNPSQELLRTLKGSFGVVSPGEDQGRGPHLSQPVRIGESGVHVLGPDRADQDALLGIACVNLHRREERLVVIGRALHEVLQPLV